MAYSDNRRTDVSVCPACGWWRASQERQFSTVDLGGASGGTTTYGAVGALRNLDLSDISLPLKDVRDYLIAKYESRFDVHPRLMEEVVGSVFRDAGYETVVTSYSADGGLDAILTDSESTIGVQVKRYRDSIQAHQIRELVGALVLEGVPKGLFITTSEFTRGARESARKASELGTPIELMNAEAFLAELSISQRRMYGSREEFDTTGCLRKLEPVSHESEFSWNFDWDM